MNKNIRIMRKLNNIISDKEKEISKLRQLIE